MKRYFFISATLMLAATLALAGCDPLSFFEQEKGERFDVDGLEQVFEAMAAKNYTVDMGDGAINYIMENAIVKTIGPSKPGMYTGITEYTYYDTASYSTASNGNVSVKTRILYQYGDSSSPYDFHYKEDVYIADSIQELYDDVGITFITTFDWEYDKAEKLYRCDPDEDVAITLKIGGKRVTLTIEMKLNDGDSEFQTAVLKNFGATEYDLSVFSRNN